MSIEDKAKKFALKCHKGQKYGSENYSYHLKLTIEVAKKYKLSESIVSACWLHDVIEDCNISYWEVKTQFSEKIAEIVYAVTDELGRNRKERKQKTYPKIATNEDALCVKLCDRIANIKESIRKGQYNFVSMYGIEKREFYNKLFNPKHCKKTLQLWECLNGFYLVDNKEKVTI